MAQSPSNGCEGETFYHAPITEEEIYREFGRSVFRIEGQRAGRSVSGTGYLIDAEQGFVLTALHVVRDAFDNRSLTITATTPGLPETKLTLEVVDRMDPPVDVALLRIKNSAPILDNHIRAFDFALERIAHSNRYYNIGYPRGKQTQNRQPVTVQGDYEGRTDPGNPQWTIPAKLLLDVKQDVDDGHSGSPLIDEEGAVVATCIDSLSGGVALYVPMDKVQKLLDEIPPDKRVRSLDNELKTVRDDQDWHLGLLIQELEWRSGSPSNLELYKWATQMSQSQGAYSSRSSYFGCPLGPAYEQRRLGTAKAVQFVRLLAAFSSSGSVARNLLNASQRALDDGRPDLSVALSKSAFEWFGGGANGLSISGLLYAPQSNSKTGQTAALTQMGRAYLSLNRYTDASSALQQAISESPDSQSVPKTKVFLAAAYQGTGQRSLATQYAREALPELQQAGDKEGQALALKTLGAIALSDGQYSLAKKDFSGAFDLYMSIGDSQGASSTKDLLNIVGVRLSNTAWARLTRFPTEHKIVSIVSGLGAALAGVLFWLFRRSQDAPPERKGVTQLEALYSARIKKFAKILRPTRAKKE